MGQGDDEQLLAAEPVGQPPEVERADDLPNEVHRAGEAHLGGIHVKALGIPVRGDELDLETVEDPGHAESRDDRPVKPRPREPVHPGSDGASHRLVLHR